MAIQKVVAQQPVESLGVQLAAWAKSSGVGAQVQWKLMDDDEIRGLTVGLVTALGVKEDHAPRVVAKINGLLAV